MLPNYLIVGAAKSGTTTLHDLLSQHPEVYMPSEKELVFFSCGSDAGITSINEYESFFEGANGYKAVGEASVSYLFDPEAPIRIFNTLGENIKILIILRNPVDMMYSLWGHMRRVQREKLGFIDALNAEACRKSSGQVLDSSGGWICDLLYTERARYSTQVERYINIFGRDRVMILVYEEFFSRPAEKCAELFQFLGVDPQFMPEFKRLNPAGVSRFGALHRALNSPYALKDFAKIILPAKARLRVKSALNKINRKDMELSPLNARDRHEVWARVVDDVGRLENLLALDLRRRWWRDKFDYSPVPSGTQVK